MSEEDRTGAEENTAGLGLDLVRGDVLLPEDRTALGLSYRVGKHFAELMIPLTAIISFDNLFFGVGWGLEAGLGISLGYAAWVFLKSMRRGRQRGELGDDPSDRLEDSSDFVSDIISAVILIFLVSWVLPASPYLIEAGQVGTAYLLWAAAGVFGVAGFASLREGVLRGLTYFGAKRDIDDWDPASLLSDHGDDELLVPVQSVTPDSE